MLVCLCLRVWTCVVEYAFCVLRVFLYVCVFLSVCTYVLLLDMNTLFHASPTDKN